MKRLPQSKRLLNIELLRIIAMFMVLNLHANFLSFKNPSLAIEGINSIIARDLWESLCLCAVNVFVMISGWFGIKFSIRGFANFMWQVFYIVCLLSLVNIFILHEPINHKIILMPLGLYGGGGWFVPAYIFLYLIAPALNLLVEHTPRKTLRLILIVFFILETIWGMTNPSDFFQAGYSPTSFIGLYLLAAFLRRSNKRIKSSSAFILYLICTLAVASILIFETITSNTILGFFYSYASILVIAAAAFLLLSFTGLQESAFHKRPWEKIIPWLSTSCFAVYLLHVGTPFALKFYTTTIRESYYAHPGIVGALCVAGIILGVFFAAILIDRPRVWIWRSFLLPLFGQKETSKTKENEAMIG